MEQDDLLVLAELFADSAKEYVTPKLKALEGLIHKQQEHIKTLETLLATHAATLSDVNERLELVPPDPVHGKDGKDADPEMVRSLVAEELSKTPRAERIDVTAQLLPAVVKELTTHVENILKEIPRPVEQEVVQRMIEQHVALSVGALPKPKDGKDGTNGKDVDMEAVIAAAVQRLPIPKDGKDGESIHPDTLRVMIIDAVKKEFSDMPKPRDGRDGTPGRDALEIEILPVLDTAKTITRGTFVYAHGGTLRARMNTTPGEFKASEWDVVADGVQRITVDQKDARSFVVNVIQTSGKTSQYPFTMPVLLYQEIWEASKTYVRGDVVTWDNSAWYCQAESTKGRSPEKNNDWRLMVRKGGKGEPGLRGDKGEPGVNGKDYDPLHLGNKF